jgi:DNA helicase-2/ATP-dependent DNA helicase PcrA
MDEKEPEGPSKSGIKGNFKSVRPQLLPKVDIDNFVPSPSEQIAVGMSVIHLKFGQGKVMGVDGGKDNRIATIHFADLVEEPQKKIMLKFAKLQIVE